MLLRDPPIQSSPTYENIDYEKSESISPNINMEELKRMIENM